MKKIAYTLYFILVFLFFAFLVAGNIIKYWETKNRQEVNYLSLIPKEVFYHNGPVVFMLQSDTSATWWRYENGHFGPDPILGSGASAFYVWEEKE